MLLVRVLDRHRDRQPALVFALAENGEFGVLSGDAGLVDPEARLADEHGAVFTRRQPQAWAAALGRALAAGGRYELVAEDLGTSPAGSPGKPGAAGGAPPGDAPVAAPRSGVRRRAPVLLGVLLLVGLAAAAAVGASTRWFGLKHTGPRAAAPIVSRAQARHRRTLDPAAVRITGGTAARRRTERIANNAARELIGSGDHATVSFDASSGLWDFPAPATATPSPTGRMPTWWQSGIAVDALVRYAMAIKQPLPAVQQLLTIVYTHNVDKPGTFAGLDFENNYMDDTGWWGIAWADAARYELQTRHDRALATTYLHVAEHDAAYIAAHHGRCGARAISFKPGWQPNTITDAEFIDLTARLAQLRSGGGLAERGLARRWSADARGTLAWLEHSGLVDLATGSVHLTDSGNCRATGAAQTYTEGEVADALSEVGVLTHDPLYTNQAAVFINHVLKPTTGMLVNGVLNNPCEAQRGLCAGRPYNLEVFDGLLDQAVADWSTATGSTAYDAFVGAQARAIVANATGVHAGACATPHGCQLSMYWARLVPASQQPLPADVGSQAGGLYALTDALVLHQDA